MTPTDFDSRHMIVYLHDRNDPLLQWPLYPLPDLATELSGSLGLAGSLNAGNKYAMAQAQHGAAPDIAEKNIAILDFNTTHRSQ